MNQIAHIINFRVFRLSALLCLGLFIQAPQQQLRPSVEASRVWSRPARQTTSKHALRGRGKDEVNANAYILGPGDVVKIELLDVPEYSGIFTIDPHGNLYIPRLRSVVVEGLTIEDLRYLLTNQFRAYVNDPQVFVNISTYRPIRVYIGGEVRRPGYYYLSGKQGCWTVVLDLERPPSPTEPNTKFPSGYPTLSASPPPESEARKTILVYEYPLCSMLCGPPVV